MREMRIFVINRGWISIAAAVLSVVAVFFVITIAGGGAGRTLPIYRVERDNRAVSLTFNASRDGDIEAITGILAQYNVRATFFVTGEFARRNPDTVTAADRQGHEIMNLSDDYARFVPLPAAQVAANVTAANEEIGNLTGKVPALFRAPHGEYDDHVIEIVHELGMRAIQWDVDSRDYRGISAERITRRVTGAVSPGSIVKFRAESANTPEALPEIIEFLLQNGYAIVPVSELLLHGEYTIDRAGRQLPVRQREAA
ncbi:MAG: polysaccharide deacetylase family protein [Oscillospiraceae bacterium]|nr:polysaccharide deacetylase family protein [Oscillospiraceae bacterium]